MQARLVLLTGLCFSLLYAVGWSQREERNAGVWTIEEAGSHKLVNKLTQIVSTWKDEFSELATLYCEIDVESRDGTNGTSTQRRLIVRMMNVNDLGICLSLETQEQFDGAWGSTNKWVITKNLLMEYEHASNNVYVNPLTSEWNVDLESLSQFLFPLVPFSSYDEESLAKRFQVEIVREDKDWTFVRFVPRGRERLRQYILGQVGVVNYENQLSPRYFPLVFQWRDPANNTYTWTVKALQLNEPGTVVVADFILDLDALKRKGWTVSWIKDSQIVRWVFSKE